MCNSCASLAGLALFYFMFYFTCDRSLTNLVVSLRVARLGGTGDSSTVGLLLTAVGALKFGFGALH